MDHDFYIEEGDYLIRISAQEEAAGDWTAWAYFERKSDLQKSLVPGMRHRILHRFNSGDEASQAAHQFAIDRVKKDDVGL